jgi:hypothetical protein
MSTLPQGLATRFYQQAAKFSAHMLACSPIVESVHLHRSVATGEVSFGRSDIDILMVIDERKADDGESIAALVRLVNRARLVNPALSHVDVYEPSALASYARGDTFWASSERRTLVPLRGRPVVIPSAPVHPDHALSRFLLWVEWYFSIAVQQKDRRNLWKTALEAWNAYASAEGFIQEPCLSRSEMEAQARRLEADLSTDRLRDPSYAIRFVFELADRLHRSRLRPLRTLARPLIFEAITAPLCLPRLFVVLPRVDAPLPPEAFVPGAFPCTPEFLDLFTHAKNPFLQWVLPPELADLGIAPPLVPEFLSACRFYGHSRFLFIPGFANSGPPTQTARMALIRHAAEWATRGELPPAISQEGVRETLTSGVRTITGYYREDYSSLRRESRRIQESLLALSGAASV